MLSRSSTQLFTITSRISSSSFTISTRSAASASLLRPSWPALPPAQHLRISSLIQQQRHNYHSNSTTSSQQPGYIGISSPPTSSLAHELNLRCTVLTASGIKSVSGAFRKMDLCLEHGLEPRDLRKVDSRIPNLVPTILARKQAFLVNILHIRALIKSDTVFLFDSYGSSDTTLHSAFVYNLEHNLRAPTSSNKLPFEFRALETALSSALDALRSELYLTSDMVHYLLESLDSHINQENLGRLLQYSRKVNAFLRRAQGVKTSASEVMESDEDMALMYLTDAQAGNPRDPNTSSIEELELLLESFEKQVEEVVSEAESMASNIQNTQEVVELILDSNRNDLLNLDLRTSLTTLAVSSGTLVSGLFGMNLLSHLEEHPHAFFGISSLVGLITACVMALGWRMLARLRRVGLQQQQGGVLSGWGGNGNGAGASGNGLGYMGSSGGGLQPVAAAAATMTMPPAVAAAWQVYGKTLSVPSSSPSSTQPPPYAARRPYGQPHQTSSPPSSHKRSILGRMTNVLWKVSGGEWRERRRRSLMEKSVQAQAQEQASRVAEMEEVRAQAQARVSAQAKEAQSPPPSPPPPPPPAPPSQNKPIRTPAEEREQLEYEAAAQAWLADRHAEEARWRERGYVREQMGAFGAWGLSGDNGPPPFVGEKKEATPPLQQQGGGSLSGLGRKWDSAPYSSVGKKRRQE
ncbi:hypothetical protein A4X13_0g2500 [Tilletia indica]|uniref:Uncharacterized protein n=1 Tax=Tilletia indica TaxID=43049 RepID=A0A177TE31_9BASI|nr:hypothetical protein A4X13_0g2500 [Tilletia indica]